MNHSEDCRCWDCAKEVVKMIMPGGNEFFVEVVVIRTELGNSYLCREVYEGPALMLA